MGSFLALLCGVAVCPKNDLPCIFHFQPAAPNPDCVDKVRSCYAAGECPGVGTPVSGVESRGSGIGWSHGFGVVAE